MAFLKVALFVAFTCLVSAVPQIRRLDKEEGWKKTATVSSQTTVYDGSLNKVAFVNITVATFNYTQDSYQQLSSTVRRNLANIQVDSEAPQESLRVYEGDNTKLPLAFNLSLVEVVSMGPKPRDFAIQLLVDVYAKKKHRAGVLESLKNFSL